MYALLTNAARVLDGKNTNSWENVFWPFWILSALYFGATVISLISFLWRAVPFVFCCFEPHEKKGLKVEVLTSMWITLNIVGFCIGSVIIIYNIEQSLLNSKPGDTFQEIIVGLLGYVMLLILYTFLIKNHMSTIFLPEKKPSTVRIFSSEHSRTPVVISGSRTPQLRQSSELVSEVGAKKKKKMAIPKYLMKLNDDFFATVTAKQVFLTKMDKMKSKIK